MIIREFFKDRIVKYSLIFSAASNIGLALFFLFFMEQGNLPIVLHYNVNQGVDYFGNMGKIFILPLVGILVILIDGILALKIFRKNRFLSYFLLVISTLVQVFIFMGGIALYLINS